MLHDNMRSIGELRIKLNESWKNKLPVVDQETALNISGHINKMLGYK